MRRSIRALIVAALVAMALPPAAGAADRLISDELYVAPDFEASPLAAYGGALAWFREDDDALQLVVHRGGTTRAPRAPHAGELALDLGPGRGGGPVAVYPRCGERCDLVEHAIASGRTRLLRAISSRRRSEEAGATWRGRYLFARRGSGVFAFRPLRRLTRQLTYDLDLRGSWAAYRVTGRRWQVLRVRRLPRGRTCTLARIRPLAEGEGTLGLPRPGHGELFSPVLDGGHLYWLDYRSYGDEAKVTLRRRRLPGRRCRSRGRIRVGRDLPASDLAVDGGRVFYSDTDGVFEATDPVPRF